MAEEVTETEPEPAVVKRARLIPATGVMAKEISPPVALTIIVVLVLLVAGGYMVTHRRRGPAPPGAHASKAQVREYYAWMMKHRTDKN